jgi:hypothetical protein
MKNVNRERQEELFHEIVAMQYSMQGLAGFVQNDFERMLADGTTTQEGITEAIADMDESFDRVVVKLNTLREKCREVMTHYADIETRQLKKEILEDDLEEIKNVRFWLKNKKDLCDKIIFNKK